MAAPWGKGPKDGYVFFPHSGAAELQGCLPLWDDDIKRLKREVERGGARGGQYYGEKGFARRRTRLVEQRLELRRARIELRARAGHPRTAARLQWIGECRQAREEILYLWTYGARIWNEITGAETGQMANGVPYAAATLRTYARRLPGSREHFAKARHELNILVETSTVPWRAGRLRHGRRAGRRHLRVLDGGRA